MKKQTRRRFINSVVGGSIGIGAMPLLSFEDKKELPVINEVDICVLGGSCTGVFAAVRAARLGASVAIVEKQNAFGGVATSGLVNIWHSLYNTEKDKQIIAGLTYEVVDRLSIRDASVCSEKNGRGYYTLNTQELKIELDELVLESGITPYFHTLFSEPYFDSKGELAGVIVDNKSGRSIIKAKYFVDATGDGDLSVRMGLKSYQHPFPQPPTSCAQIEGFNGGMFNALLKEHSKEFDIPDGYVWGAQVPSTSSYMLAGTRVYGLDCSNADDLTKAEIEGRRQVRAMMDMIRGYGKDAKVGLTALPSYIGIRETRHIECLYQITDEDALYGKSFHDAIANGSYVLDLHHQDKPGITFRHLDGKEIYTRPGYPSETGRWRERTETNPTYYQVPLRALIPKKSKNLIVAGRMLDASPISFSGIRVMVNTNQMGEAAGVAAYLAMNEDKPIKDVSYQKVRSELSKGGSIII